jgi:riboflavin kinase/FMN adenylyltransferase
MTVLSWDEFCGGKRENGGIFRDKSAVTIGVFDGVHRGHRVLLQKAAASGFEPVVVTFRNHPRSIVAHRKAPKLLITVEERLAIFEKEGVSVTVLIDFSQRFSILSGRAFLETLRKNAALAYMVIGSTFRCGHRGTVDAAEVARINAEAGIRTEIVEPVQEDGIPVSSSRIREALVEGNVALAERMLGRKLELF